MSEVPKDAQEQIKALLRSHPMISRGLVDEVPPWALELALSALDAQEAAGEGVPKLSTAARKRIDELVEDNLAFGDDEDRQLAADLTMLLKTHDAAHALAPLPPNGITDRVAGMARAALRRRHQARGGVG